MNWSVKLVTFLSFFASSSLGLNDTRLRTGREEVCPRTVPICDGYTIDMADLGFFQRNFTSALLSVALFWHELGPDYTDFPEANPKCELQNDYMVMLKDIWQPYNVIYDNGWAFFTSGAAGECLYNKPNWINNSYVQAHAAKVLKSDVFLLAINISPTRIKEYNKLTPLSEIPKAHVPIVNVFCVVEAVALRGVKIHVIDSLAAWHYCTLHGPHQCKAWLHENGRLRVRHICGGLNFDEVIRTTIGHPEHGCVNNRARSTAVVVQRDVTYSASSRVLFLLVAVAMFGIAYFYYELQISDMHRRD